MKTIIAGSRSITSYATVLRAIKASGFAISEVVSGTARGVDALGELWAMEHSVPIKRFPPDWRAHGKAAGPLRNEEMARYADALVAVRRGGRASRGTTDMIARAQEHGLKVYVLEAGR